MKRKIITLIVCILPMLMQAQTRYLEEVFTTVDVTKNVVYGQNIDVLVQALRPLTLDVYEPAGDTVAERPLIILFPNSNFLPTYSNGTPLGRKSDSSMVELAMRLAKRGYVAAIAEQRLGWNPLSNDQNVRTGTLINAVYRSIQDAYTAIRFFNKDYKDNGNTFGIDTGRIVLGGANSSAYTPINANYMDRYPELSNPKILNVDSVPPEPFIDTAISGDFKGTLQRQLNIPNHVGYNDRFHMIFSLSGGVGDTSWVEAGDVPSVGFHPVNNPEGPYKTGPVFIVTPTGMVLFVLEVSGYYDIQKRAERLGVNNVFKNRDFMTNPVAKPYTQKANELNEGITALYPFMVANPTDSLVCPISGKNAKTGEPFPWDWWCEQCLIDSVNARTPGAGAEVNCKMKLRNPNNPARAKMYIDTIIGYLTPRMMVALDLPQNKTLFPDITGIKDDLRANGIKYNGYPNPAEAVFNVQLNGASIEAIEIYDLRGKLVFKERISADKTVINVGNLPSGLYLVKLSLDTGLVVTEKLQVK